MRFVLALAATLVAAAGCVLPGSTVDPSPATDVPFDDLPSSAASAVTNADGTRTLSFEGATKAGAGAVGAAITPGETPLGTFDVDERVGFAQLTVDVAGAPPQNTLAGVIVDGEGRIQCAVIAGSGDSCTVPAIAKDTWSVYVRPIQGAAPPDLGVTGVVTLHPPSHLVRGDPLAGVDPEIRFRVSDTGVEGSEDNIGVLADGTIFTQKGTSTMRSKDDGATWENVAPPGNDRFTLDPMLFVDPARDLVLVDHLYVACSMLSWSSDAGESWLTNPFACGLPADDHQKIATGPSPVPGSPLPAVYYTFSSFAEGIFASRSYDGGVTWTSSPVVGVGDGRSYANTGPIWADERGNVYIPIYMCDGEGYMGVGVSRDYGLTWKFVEAAQDPGPCYDVDPGLWADTDGTVYLAYHRPTGVKYVYSSDAGETWSAPVVVSPPSLKSFVHVDAVAGSPGRLAIVYRATPDTDKGPDLADGWAAWHLYVTFVENATSATPTIRTGIVDDPAIPMQVGPICTNGIACYGGSRNLLDFIDIAVGPDGRVYPTYTAGCPMDEPCRLPADSRGSLGLVGVQETGPRLFEGAAPWAAGAGSLL